MGNMAIVFAGVALVLALVCLFIGFSWGRSNLQSQVEQAVEKERVSSDTREFAMRQQLDEAIAEIARLRPLVGEYSEIQERRKPDHPQLDQRKDDPEVPSRDDSSPEPEAVANGSEKAAPPKQSADEAIHKLLKSLENTLQQPNPASQDTPPSPPVAEYRPGVAEGHSSAPSEGVGGHAVPQQAPSDEGKKEPSAPQKMPQVEDEWQEFARSLADLTQRRK